ncbi:MAG: aminopeptidase P family protein [Anaerolineae bacterium]|nr:aminopeptidase P family protein [Anaerolineae bacterium]
MPERLEKLQKILEVAGVDALVLVPGANFRYVTGSSHHLSERPTLLFVTPAGRCVAVLPFLEAAKFGQKFQAEVFPWTDAEGYDGALAAAWRALGLKTGLLGVEGQRLRFFEAEILQRHAPEMTLRSVDVPLSTLRLHKTPQEIEHLRTAIRMSEAALQATLAEVRPSMTERQIASRLELHLNAQGGEGLSFETVVLGGANTALPHGSTGSYALQPGDALLFDFGTTYQGYQADITRTFFLGEPAPEHRALYAAVLAANETGRAACRPGVAAGSVDLAATQALMQAGFEKFIRHRTGHGLGLETHEAPYIVQTNTQVLAEGMVFTIEPGLYQEGSLGVRIEDNVVITPEGAESLTRFPRELTILG